MVEIETTKEKIEEVMEAKPVEAAIIFKIPAYQNKDGTPFEREVSVPTKKAYAIYKNLVRWKYED